MTNTGYTDAEQEWLERIDDLRDPVAKEEEVKKFEAETGKEFPTVVFRLNTDTIGLRCTNGDKAFDRWFVEESWKNRGRRIF